MTTEINEATKFLGRDLAGVVGLYLEDTPLEGFIRTCSRENLSNLTSDLNPEKIYKNFYYNVLYSLDDLFELQIIQNKMYKQELESLVVALETNIKWFLSDFMPNQILHDKENIHYASRGNFYANIAGHASLKNVLGRMVCLCLFLRFDARYLFGVHMCADGRGVERFKYLENLLVYPGLYDRSVDYFDEAITSYTGRCGRTKCIKQHEPSSTDPLIMMVIEKGLRVKRRVKIRRRVRL